MSTFGPAYDPSLDGDRVALQMERIRLTMSDGEWRTLPEISALTGDPEASISAQLRHLRKPRFGSFDVQKRRRGDWETGLWEYRVLPPTHAEYAPPSRQTDKERIAELEAENAMLWETVARLRKR